MEDFIEKLRLRHLVILISIILICVVVYFSSPIRFQQIISSTDHVKNIFYLSCLKDEVMLMNSEVIP